MIGDKMQVLATGRWIIMADRFESDTFACTGIS